MKCIVGLGNPGKKYEGTRHNLGFNVIAKIAEKLNVDTTQQKFNSIFAKTQVKGETILLVQPLTFMNRSGQAVREVVDFYKLDMDDLLVIYDDKDFNIGQVRLRKQGSAGGHNGIKSIINSLGTNEFNRMRLGIGAPEYDQINHVLSKFYPEEQKVIDKVIDHAAEAVIYFANNTMDNTMNKYNIDISE